MIPTFKNFVKEGKPGEGFLLFETKEGKNTHLE